jgi:hypothetical protein
MIASQKRTHRWLIAAGTTIGGALLAAAAAEAWGIPARVTTLEANDKSNHELLQEVRQDVKELLRR